MKLVHKILIFTLLPLFLVVGIAVINLQNLSSKVKAEIENSLVEKRGFVLESLQQKQKNISYIADILANAIEVMDATEVNDADVLYRWGRLFLAMEPHRITFTDKNGVVIARGHSEFEFGDSLQNSAIFQAASKESLDGVLFDPHPKLISTRKILKHDEIVVGYLLIEVDVNDKLLSTIAEAANVKILQNQDAQDADTISAEYPPNTQDKKISLKIKKLEDSKEEELKSLQKKILFGSFLLALIMSMFIYFFVKRTLRPANIMVDKMRAYSNKEIGMDELISVAGTLSVERNEFGEINRSFKETLQNLRETQKQLIESEKMSSLGSLVAGVAHEINTPIGICITAVSYLEEQLKIAEKEFKDGVMKRSTLMSFFEKSSEALASTISNLHRAANLIASFKEVSVDQSSEVLRTFDLKKYLEEIVLSLKPKLKKTKHQLFLVCDSAIVMESYPGAISQIITNLVMNSLVHGFENKESGMITILASANEDDIFIDYSDDGKGMSKEVLRQIFDPFFTTKRGKGGTGLGMHIVYNLITQRLKGTVSCESVESHGTRFLIHIPRKIA